MAYNSGSYVQRWAIQTHAPPDESPEMRLLHKVFTTATTFVEKKLSGRSRAESQILHEWISYRVDAREQIFQHFVQYVRETHWEMLGETDESTERQESVQRLNSIAILALSKALERHKANVEAQIGQSPPAPNPLDPPPILSSGPVSRSNESLPNEGGSTRPRSTYSQGSDEMFVMEK